MMDFSDQTETSEEKTDRKKTNYFLGICREHAHNTATEFTNEGDMEELFQTLDDGVHHAGEVRTEAFFDSVFGT